MLRWPAPPQYSMQRLAPGLFRRGLALQSTIARMAYSTDERGSLHSEDYRLFIKNGDSVVSPFHDIPLHANAEKTVFNMIVEIPRWTNAKMEINLGEQLNPIKQDIKKGKVRFVNNCFPYHGYIWNYGAFPQTWEDPTHTDPDTKANGDNDPLDVCELGSKVATRGEVKQVKILGTIALIDEGETDWKVLVIDVADPLAPKMNDISDIETHMPGYLKATVNWFRIYKIPTGKPPNQFAFDGEARNKEFAVGVVQKMHDQWKALVQRDSNQSGISCVNTTLTDNPHCISPDAAKTVVAKTPPPGPAHPIPLEVDNWHFV